MNHEQTPQPLSEKETILAIGYVLKDLNDSEEEAAVQLLQENSEFVKEVNALRASFDLIPNALPKTTPPPSLKSKIQAAYLEEFSPQDVAETPSPVTIEAANKLKSRWSKSQLIAAIATIISLLLAASNFSLRRQIANRNLIEQNPNQQLVTALQNSKSRLVALEGKDNLEAKGNFLFTPGRWEKEVFVALDNLPRLPQGKVYRMWVLIKGGAIFFCGEFNTDAQGSIFVRLDPEGEWPKGAKPDTVFVTVEDVSASPEPSPQKILVGEI